MSVLMVGLLLGCEPSTTDLSSMANASGTDDAMFSPAPPKPRQLGTLPMEASSEQADALWWVNTYRRQAGLGPMDQVQTINIAASAHAQFVDANPQFYAEGQLSLHQQSPDGVGFTGESFWERMSAAGYLDEPYREVIARQPTAAAAVAHWMESLYHRLPLLQPVATHMGYGAMISGTDFVNVLDVGIAPGPEVMVGNGVAWPPSGMRDVAVSWDGMEEPQPPPPIGGYPSGPVVTLIFSRSTELTLIDHKMIDVTAGSSLISHTALSPENDIRMKENTAVALYADSPLNPGREIEVDITVDANGKSIRRVWRFFTQNSTTCNVFNAQCGIGKACYTGSDFQGVCHWAGVLDSGDACSVQNECASGLTCVQSLGQCAQYCRWKGSGSQSCATRCTHGKLLVNSSNDLGVCVPGVASSAK